MFSQVSVSHSVHKGGYPSYEPALCLLSHVLSWYGKGVCARDMGPKKGRGGYSPHPWKWDLV